MRTQITLLAIAVLFVIAALTTQIILIEKIPPTYRPPIIITETPAPKGTVAPYQTPILIDPRETNRPYQTPIH